MLNDLVTPVVTDVTNTVPAITPPSVPVTPVVISEPAAVVQPITTPSATPTALTQPIKNQKSVAPYKQITQPVNLTSVFVPYKIQPLIYSTNKQSYPNTNINPQIVAGLYWLSGVLLFLGIVLILKRNKLEWRNWNTH